MQGSPWRVRKGGSLSVQRLKNTRQGWKTRRVLHYKNKSRVLVLEICWNDHLLIANEMPALSGFLCRSFVCTRTSTFHSNTTTLQSLPTLRKLLNPIFSHRYQIVIVELFIGSQIVMSVLVELCRAAVIARERVGVRERREVAEIAISVNLH